VPTLIHEFDYHVDVGGVADVGTGPYGHRMIAAGSGGKVVGDRLTGTIAPSAGGDWLLLGQDGYGRLDVRNTVLTADGACVYIQLHGLVELTPAVLAVFAGGAVPTDFGGQYFVTTPRLETGDERYAWVNRVLFVAEARILPGPCIDYRVFRVG
jgi:hypothetical protein